jgi:hypothetical protein
MNVNIINGFKQKFIEDTYIPKNQIVKNPRHIRNANIINGMNKKILM